MKTTNMKYYYIILILLLTASCKTSFRISVQEPARIKLDNNTKTIGVLNNVSNDNSPDKVIQQLLTSETLNGNIIASERAVDGAHRALERSNYLRPVTLQKQPVKNAGGEIQWNLIDSICNANQLDAIIEFGEIRSISPVGGTVLANATGQSNTRLDGWLYVNVYELNTKLVVERFSIRRNYSIPVSGNVDIIAILNDVQRKREYFRALGYELGYGAGRLVYPNWVWVDRTYYTKGSPALKRAKPMIKEGNWDIAEKQLKQDLDNRKAKVRGRVLYNLALVYEGQGMIDLALEAAENSALEGNKLANEYLVKLRKRQQQINQL